MAESIGSAPGDSDATTRGELLLVDNDVRIVELLSWFLGNQGFGVRTAGSFVEARELLSERRTDLLISDVDLGTESAVAELPKLSAEGLLPPVLVVSGFLDDKVQAALFSVPEVLDTLPKPFEFPDLEAKVVACLAGEVERPVMLQPSAGSVGQVPVASKVLGDEPAPTAGVAPVSQTADEDDDGWTVITPGG